MKKMSKGMLITALICGAVYLGGSPVYANELQEFSLDEYVVTAARTETKLVDTPANISVVDAKTIEERHYQDVSEVLKDVPGANVLDSGAGAYEKKIVINGDERVLILVDGRRMNFDMGTMSRSGFDMNQLPEVGLIERIEVLKGSGGALYGSDAVGGVVNIITKKTDRNLGKVSIASGSMGTKDYNVVYSIKEDKTGINISASKYEQDYYKFRDAKTDKTKRWPFESNYKNEKISLKIDQELTKDSNLIVGYDYSKFEGWNPYHANNTVKDFSSYLDKKTQNIYAKYDWKINENDTGYLQVYHNRLEYNNKGGMEEKTNGLEIQQAINTSDNNKLVVGMSYRNTDVFNEINYAKEESIDNLALFVNDVWEVAPTWTFNAGVRYDNHSEAGNETTFSTGLNKKFNDYSHMYLNWGQVFKAPTVDDLFYNSGYQFGDRNLKPETGETWTIGYATKINENTDISLNYFESDINDAISWLCYDPVNWYYRAANIAKQETRGAELSLQHKVNDNVNLNASYTYVNVKSDYQGYGLLRDAHYMPNTYRIGVNYKDGKWNSNIWLRAGSGGATNNSPRYGFYGPTSSLPYVDSSYWTVDMAITYQATNDLSLYVKGYNLFNEAYAEQAGVSGGSYNYPAQSRRFIVGAEYKF